MKNHFVNELDLTSFKFAAIKWFFKSLEESAKCHQKILCGHTDELKCLAYRHVLKTVVKVMEEKFNFFVFFLNLIQVHQFTQSATLIPPVHHPNPRIGGFENHAVNCLNPYAVWLEFRHTIVRCLKNTVKTSSHITKLSPITRKKVYTATCGTVFLQKIKFNILNHDLQYIQRSIGLKKV